MFQTMLYRIVLLRKSKHESKSMLRSITTSIRSHDKEQPDANQTGLINSASETVNYEKKA